MAWTIVVKPEGKNPGAEKEGSDPPEGRNEGGMVIGLYDDQGGFRQEVSRVAFVRENSIRPDLPFAEALDSEMEKAKKAVEVLNGQLVGDGSLV